MAVLVRARDLVGGIGVKIRAHFSGTAPDEHAQYITEDPAFASSTVSVTIGTTTTTALVANAIRRGGYFYNNYAEPILLAYGGTATTSLFFHRLEPFQGWDMPRPLYLGVVSAIRLTGSGPLLVTEST